jgi:hypothetical protein
MSRPGFFDENLNRAYPFQLGSAGVNVPASGLPTMLQLPDNFVVDCGFTIYDSQSFDPSVHTVFLQSVSRTGSNTAVFVFQCSDPALSSKSLSFVRTGEDRFRTYFNDGELPYDELNSDSNSSVIFPPYVPCGWPFWGGYVVFGAFADFAARVSIGQTIERSSNTESIVLPTLVTNYSNSRVTSINVANKDRTRAVAAAGCPEYVWDFPTGETYIRNQCLGGSIVFRGGYNLSASQSGDGRSLRITPTINGGLGQPCEEIKLFDTETGPTGHGNSTLSGDILCNEVFRTINGLPGPTVTLLPGDGVSVVGDPDNNTVIVDVNLNSLAVCDTSDLIDISESV